MKQLDVVRGRRETEISNVRFALYALGASDREGDADTARVTLDLLESLNRQLYALEDQLVTLDQEPDHGQG